ncbi:MAG: hypothetical protein H7249_00010 [Chitinophagaceae bacterium]|nr:hypothetical protein [Oligoflexus sp.]
MTETYRRRLSFSERLYLASLRRDGQGIVVQYLLEGEGRLEKNVLEDAIRTASRANPGSRLILKGHLGRSYWEAKGAVPPVRTIQWDRNAPLPIECQRYLDPRQGPTVEILWTDEPNTRIVFRALHSVMDGGGLFLFIEDIFRALRKEPLKGAASELNDSEFLEKVVGERYRKPLAFDFPPLFAEMPSGGPDVHEARYQRTLAQKPQAVAAKIAVGITNALGQGRTLRFMIPTDVRNYKRDVRSTGNLSYPLFLDVRPGETVEEVQKMMFKSLVGKDMLFMDPAEKKGLWIPMIILRRLVDLLYFYQRYFRKGFCSVFISHASLPGGEVLSCPGFRHRSLGYLPARFKMAALAISSINVGFNHDLVVFGNQNFLSEAQLAQVVSLVSKTLDEIPA